MSFAISDTLVSCRVLEEESLTSSQLSLSCTVQSFFSEATSCSALFSLGVGQGLAALVQSRGYRFFSPLFSQKTAKILSSVASSITEGICFNTASELARSGELQMGSLTENFHGISIILVCKAMGRGVLAHSAVVKNLVQNSALMAVDVTFEECGWIERRNFTLVERYFNCQLTSFRMEVSASFLGTVCPEVGILRAKLELDYELQKPGRKQSSSKNRHWIDPFLDLFSPELAGNNGEKIRNIFLSKSEETLPIRNAADLILKTEGSGSGKEKAGSSSIRILDKLPPTVKKRLNEIGKEKRDLAIILIDTWMTLYQTPQYIQGVADRGNLMIAYRKAVESYCDAHPKIDRNILSDFGVSIFFAQIPEGEAYHFPHPELSGQAKAGEYEINKSRRITYEDFIELEKRDPERAKWVKFCLAIWSEHCFRKKEKNRKSSQDPKNKFDMTVRKFLKDSKFPITIHYFLTDILDIATEFLGLHEKISKKVGHPNLEEFHPSKPLDIQELHATPKIRQIPTQELSRTFSPGAIEAHQPPLRKIDTVFSTPFRSGIYGYQPLSLTALHPSKPLDIQEFHTTPEIRQIQTREVFRTFSPRGIGAYRSPLREMGEAGSIPFICLMSTGELYSPFTKHGIIERPFPRLIRTRPSLKELLIAYASRHSLNAIAMAQRMNVVKSVYYRYLQGEKSPSPENLLNLFSSDPNISIQERADYYIASFPEILDFGIIDHENRLWIRGWDEELRAEKVGEFIQKKREEKKLTKEAVGRATGMTGMNIHDYESGNVEVIPLHRLITLSRVLGVDAGLLAVMAHPELRKFFDVQPIPLAEIPTSIIVEEIPLHIKIQNFIKKRGYKSGAVAKALQLSRGSAYYGMINGTHKPSLAVLLRLFKMDPDTEAREKLSIYSALYPKFDDLKIADPEGKIFVQVGREIFQQTTFGAYIRRSRERKKLSTQKMAKELEITRSTYEYLENDKMGEISYEYVEALAKTLEEDRSLLALMSHPELFEIAEIIDQ